MNEFNAATTPEASPANPGLKVRLPTARLQKLLDLAGAVVGNVKSDRHAGEGEILLVAAEGAFTVHARRPDGSMSVAATDTGGHAEVRAEGRLSVPYTFLRHAARTCRADVVNLEALPPEDHEDPERLLVAGGRQKVHIYCGKVDPWPATDWTAVAEPGSAANGNPPTRLTAADLRDIRDLVGFACAGIDPASGGAGFAIQGVNLMMSPTQGVTASGTNRFRAARCHMPPAAGPDEAENTPADPAQPEPGAADVTITRETLIAMAALAGARADQPDAVCALYQPSENELVVDLGPGLKMRAGLLQGKYPEMESLIPKGYRRGVTMNREDLEMSLRMAEAFTRNSGRNLYGNSGATGITLREPAATPSPDQPMPPFLAQLGEIVAGAKSDAGNARLTIRDCTEKRREPTPLTAGSFPNADAEWGEPPPCDIAMNVTYVKDVVRAAATDKREQVTFWCHSSSDPVLVEYKADQPGARSQTHLIMPVANS